MILFIKTEDSIALESQDQIVNKLLETGKWEVVKPIMDQNIVFPSVCFNRYVNMLVKTAAEFSKKDKNIIVYSNELEKAYSVLDEFQKKYLSLIIDSFGSITLNIVSKNKTDDLETKNIYFNYKSNFYVDFEKKLKSALDRFEQDPLYISIKSLNSYGSYLGTSEVLKKIEKIFKIQDGGPGQKISYEDFLNLVDANPDYDFLNNEYVIVRKHHPFEVLYKTGLSK